MTGSLLLFFTKGHCFAHNELKRSAYFLNSRKNTLSWKISGKRDIFLSVCLSYWNSSSIYVPQLTSWKHPVENVIGAITGYYCWFDGKASRVFLCGWFFYLLINHVVPLSSTSNVWSRINLRVSRIATLEI